jgi:hypothetical protein
MVDGRWSTHCTPPCVATGGKFVHADTHLAADPARAISVRIHALGASIAGAPRGIARVRAIRFSADRY